MARSLDSLETLAQGISDFNTIASEKAPIKWKYDHNPEISKIGLLTPFNDIL